MQALAKAQEAGVTERQLVKQRETHTPDQVNSDLTFSVLVHLGNIYQRCGMATEAIQTYTVLIKNKVFDRAGMCWQTMCAHMTCCQPAFA
jgi:intraflagellar transport protein 88